MSFRVVIAGGGVAALETALALRASASGHVSVEVVAPESEFTYRPLAVAEPFRVGEVRRFPLERLVSEAGAEFRSGTVTRVDPDEKIVILEENRTLEYDALVVTLGAQPDDAVSGALTFRGPADTGALTELLERATAGSMRRIVFAIPSTAAWPLPLYELALLTAGYLADRGTRNVDVLLVTPEHRPLELFGAEASEAIAELLDIRGVLLQTNVIPIAWEDGLLTVAGLPPIDAEAVVALPRLTGPALAGLPYDRAGFVPTDAHGRVPGTTDVYAAGDCTQFPLKQGGIATQQADAVANAIAADLGAAEEKPAPRPVVRGLLLTGFVPRYLRSSGSRPDSVIDTEPLWWPPAKIVGRHLTPFLAAQLGLSPEPTAGAWQGAMEVEVEVDPHDSASWSMV
jgi:sulfide:quinone oxidoreductase